MNHTLGYNQIGLMAYMTKQTYLAPPNKPKKPPLGLSSDDSFLVAATTYSTSQDKIS